MNYQLNNYLIPFYTFCGIGLCYLFFNRKRKPKPKLVDTSKWTIKDWQLETILSVLILENPNILKNVNKDTDAFKYFIEIRKKLHDDAKRKEILQELVNQNLLIK